jgi:hypothetical protein
MVTANSLISEEHVVEKPADKAIKIIVKMVTSSSMMLTKDT